MPRKDYAEFLNKELQDTEIAAEYLNAALESGSMDEFLVALRNVGRGTRGHRRILCNHAVESSEYVQNAF